MIKPIALYLPQFHEIAENNEWWGNGFTEWTNVKKKLPVFSGHYQPHIPLNNNYYNLLDEDVLTSQAKLAKEYGIYGFCFYHYWFNGKLLLERPLEKLLETKKPDFPFCLCWANENWTKRWDGQEKHILMKQDYDLEDDRKHIQYLLPYFKDSRYITVEGKPVFLMYRSELHPDIKRCTQVWQEEAIKAGLKGLYLIRMENFERNVHPELHGFDAGMEFAPDTTLKGTKALKKNIIKYRINKLLHSLNIINRPEYENGIYDYSALKDNMVARDKRDYQFFRCVCPSWDNSARRNTNAIIYKNSTPLLFKDWFKTMVDYTRKNMPQDQQFIFINAWNEWGEGCHLEPDEKWGYEYLEAVRAGIQS